MENPNIPQPGNYYAPAPTLPTSTLATVSVVAGILSFFALPVIGGIVALITGYMARKETRAVPPTHSGDGLATAGIIMGWINMGLTVLGVCCFVIYFVFIVGLASTGNY